jgi:hypothetical protein
LLFFFTVMMHLPLFEDGRLLVKVEYVGSRALAAAA